MSENLTTARAILFKAASELNDEEIAMSQSLLSAIASINAFVAQNLQLKKQKEKAEEEKVALNLARAQAKTAAEAAAAAKIPVCHACDIDITGDNLGGTETRRHGRKAHFCLACVEKKA